MTLRQRIMEIKCFLTNANGGYELDKKVDYYLKFYYDNLIKNQTPAVNANEDVKTVKNTIEKMASWYEMRYSDYTVMAIGNGRNDYKNNASAITQNEFLSEVPIELKWEDLLSFKSYFETLNLEEQCLLHKPLYPYIINLTKDGYDHIHVNDNGIIEEAEVSSKIFGIPTLLVGLPVEQANAMISDLGTLPKNNNLELEVEKYVRKENIREGFLSAVMHRIIERGGNRIGARRGFIFAKEFGLDLRIPMAYGVDSSDPTLNYFMETYLINNGDTDIMCIENYGSRAFCNAPLDIITFDDAYKRSLIVPDYSHNDGVKKLKRTITKETNY